MFDYIRVSKDVGVVTDRVCTTMDLSQTCSRYWVDPSGRLWIISYSGTYDYSSILPDDPAYSEEYPWKNSEVVPNGRRGKVSHVDYTGTVVVETELERGDPYRHRRILHFDRGLVIG